MEMDGILWFFLVLLDILGSQHAEQIKEGPTLPKRFRTSKILNWLLKLEMYGIP